MAVDERQRLTEDDIREGIVATMTFREALAELVPSGVPVDAHAAFYRRAAAAEIVRAWLARPQEQPRKATGEQINAAARALADGGWEWKWNEPRGPSVEAAINAALAVSVSPAAAQGWQPIETAPKDGTPIDVWGRYPKDAPGRHTDVCWRTTGGFFDDYHGHDWNEKMFRDSYGHPIIASHWMRPPAAPPSPAAQERE